MNTTIQVEKNRVDYLDMLKCLGMFIVVSGHIHTSYGWFSLPLHSYVIPLYFMLSGMTFKRDKFSSFWAFIKHRAKTLLLPYAIFSVVTWAFWAIYNMTLQNDVNIWRPLLQTFLAQGSGGFLDHNVPLWFIPCLFVIELLYYFIDKLPKWFNVITCLLLACLGVGMIHFWRGWFILLPWSIESAFVSVVFYCVGNLLTKQYGLLGIQNKVLSKKWLSIIAIIVLTLVLINTAYWNGHISLGSDLLGKSPIVFYLNAFLGIITIGLFSVLVCSIKVKGNLLNAVRKYHLWFGRNSFYIMATHVPIKGVIMVVIAKLIGKSVQFVGRDYLCCAVVFALTCAICSILAVYIGKLKRIDEARIKKRKRAK